MAKQLEFEFGISIEKEDDSLPFRYQITTFGADFPVDSLISRLSKKTIIIPHFQRQYVWSIEEASKFIESLILGLPVPSIFFSIERGTNKHLVIDGQQRLKSLQFFYNEIFDGKDFKLIGVQKRLIGKTYSSLSMDDRNALDNALIHAMIVRQEMPDDGESSIYQIFERLNSTGRALSPQEIRACLYHGEYNKLLTRLTKNQSWRLIFGKRVDNRMREEELILRFFSLFYFSEEYEKPIKNFLNKKMNINRTFGKIGETELMQTFESTISFIANSIGKNAFRQKSGVHTAIFDSVMIAIARRLKKGIVKNVMDVKERYETLTSNDKYLGYINSGTTDEANVAERIRIATEHFMDIE